jgi:acid phosphatase type 7
VKRKFAVLVWCLLLATCAPPGVFLAEPYLTLGDNAADPTRMTLLWHTPANEDAWRLEVRRGEDWRAVERVEKRVLDVAKAGAHFVFEAELRDLEPGKTFRYRLLRNGAEAFAAEGLARRRVGENQTFVVFGDPGQGTGAQTRIARQAQALGPDYVVITGDIVYEDGRMSDYQKRFFPYYNSADPAGKGAPLGRSRLFVPVIGNHDVHASNLGRQPDGLAYFPYWRVPLNGPELRRGGPHTPPLEGPESAVRQFLEASAGGYPRALNYSFDYAGAHWTMLDVNPHTDWRDPAMRRWLTEDLRAAQGAAWRFVGLHHPGFQSANKHFEQQQARWLAEIFQEQGVDVVFAGHVHNYQRSYPLRFKGAAADGKEKVKGEFQIDRRFDWAGNARPEWVIYLVTGAGGAGLYAKGQDGKPSSWQPFTARFVSKVHSLTHVTVEGRRLRVRQIDDMGREVDAFEIRK